MKHLSVAERRRNIRGDIVSAMEADLIESRREQLEDELSVADDISSGRAAYAIQLLIDIDKMRKSKEGYAFGDGGLYQAYLTSKYPRASEHD